MSFNDKIYLAQKPQFIKLFAIVVSINCIASGISWLLYAIFPSFCNGLRFKFILFVVDEFCDVFYSIFPFIVIIYDDYSDKERNSMEILFGQLNTDSAILTFFAAFVPLILLCNKCLLIINSATNKMRNDWYNKWMTIMMEN